MNRLCVLTIFAWVLLGATAPPAHALEWSLLGRYTQGTINYFSDEQDAGFRGSARAIVDLGSYELRWKEEHMGAKTWKFVGSFQSEVVRQQVFGEAYLLPR